MNLHNQIMNIPVPSDFDYADFPNKVYAYKSGHRDARHAAAELSLKAEARIEELENVLSKFVNWTTNDAGTTSLVDDVEREEYLNTAKALLREWVIDTDFLGDNPEGFKTWQNLNS